MCGFGNCTLEVQPLHAEIKEIKELLSGEPPVSLYVLDKSGALWFVKAKRKYPPKTNYGG